MFHSAFKQLREYEITFSSTVNIIKTLGGRVGVSETSFRGHGGIARRLTFRPSSMPRPNPALWEFEPRAKKLLARRAFLYFLIAELLPVE
jgi:hypothetical protein